jgi:hypothetical protein
VPAEAIRHEEATLDGASAGLLPDKAAGDAADLHAVGEEAGPPCGRRDFLAGELAPPRDPAQPTDMVNKR